MNKITFPNLNLEFNINPVATTVFGKDVYWYGIIIMTGIVLALILAHRKIKKMSELEKNYTKISWETFTDLVLLVIPIGVICARLYYCIFNWDYYGVHPEDIIKIWNGGLAIYGGVIGGVIAGLIFCKVKNIRYTELGDFCMPYVALCQSIGRWGNFVNGEAHGSRTDSFLKMGLSNEDGYFHPTFLYESICNFVFFLLLSRLYKKRKFSGQVFYLYFILYGIARFFIEGLRTDSLYIGNSSIRVSQLLSAILAGVALIIYVIKRIRAK